MPAAPLVGAGGVLLVDRQGPEIDPVHGRQGIGDLPLHARNDRLAQLAGATLDGQAARKNSALAHAALDAGVHGLVDGVEAGQHGGLRTQGEFVG